MLPEKEIAMFKKIGMLALILSASAAIRAADGLGAPSSATLRRISDSRATQFWDKRRLISHSMGEHDRRSVVWDYIAVYPAGALWTAPPPRPSYEGRPVVRIEEPARAALLQALNGILPGSADRTTPRTF
jgi:hypothetical protein